MSSLFRRSLLSLVLLTLAFPARAALPATFIDTASLAALGEKVLVVDVRNVALYLLGHAKGAIQISRDDFLETRRGVKSMVPGPKAWEALLARNGITPDTSLVVYAEAKDPYAARFVWSLRYYGHEKSWVLDGGIEKWKAEKRPTEVVPTFPVPVAGYAIRGGAPIRVEADTVLTRLYTPGVVVWDTRSRAEYLGQDVRADRGGHIPGAVHLDWVELQQEVDGVKVLKSEEELRALLAAKGLTPEKVIYAHCQTGIRSSYATLVLSGFGYARAQNYDGSWTEWGNEPSFPVEKGEGNFN